MDIIASFPGLLSPPRQVQKAWERGYGYHILFMFARQLQMVFGAENAILWQCFRCGLVVIPPINSSGCVVHENYTSDNQCIITQGNKCIWVIPGKLEYIVGSYLKYIHLQHQQRILIHQLHGICQSLRILINVLHPATVGSYFSIGTTLLHHNSSTVNG